MKKEERLANDWSEVPEIIKKFQEERANQRDCWIFIDEELIPKGSLKEDKKYEGVYYLKEKECIAGFDSDNREKYWLMWYVRTADVDYLIEWLNEEIHLFVKKVQ